MNMLVCEIAKTVVHAGVALRNHVERLVKGHHSGSGAHLCGKITDYILTAPL